MKPTNSNEDRYCDYVHRLQKISGLPPDYIGRDVLPLRDIPIRADPRRQRSLQHVIDLRHSQQDNNPQPKDESKKSLDDIPWKLRRITIPSKRTIKQLLDTAHMPNCRDPRRSEACKRRQGSEITPGPHNLVENSVIPAEEETCPVLTIDLSEWPSSIDSYIELVPHECNILRAGEFASSPNSSEQLVDVDNENVNVLLETMRQRESDDVVEIIEDDEVTELSAYNSGDTTKPMLTMNDVNCVYDVELPVTSFLGDDEPAPIPVVKPEPTDVQPVPSCDESNIDVVDLCDDDDDEDEDTRLLVPKRERSSSILCVGEQVCGVLEVITLDSDDDDDDDAANRRNASVSKKTSTPAERHVDSTSRVSDRSRIPSSLGGERESACEVLVPDASGNGVVNSDTATTSQGRQVLLDKVTPMHVDAEICEVHDNDAISAVGRNRTANDGANVDNGARINEVPANVINNEVVDFNEMWEGLREVCGPDNSITFGPNYDEAGDGDKNSDTNEPELPLELETETREHFTNDPCLLNNNKTDDKPAPRRINIVTSDAFDAQKKLLIDVISHANDDTENEDFDTLPSRIEKTTSQQATAANITTEQLQRVINDMTCANYLGRSIFANSPPIEDTPTCSLGKKKRQKSLENIEEVLERPKKKRYLSECNEYFDEDEIIIVNKPSEQPMLKENTPVAAPNASTAIALLHKGKSLRFWPARDNAPPVITSTIFTFDRALLNHLINHVKNFNIAKSSIEFMLHNYGGLSIVRAMQVVNETFWRNRYNHWSHKDWDRSICTESSDLPISEDTIDILPQDDQTKHKIDASYFLKYPALKTNKPAIESVVQTISQDAQFDSVSDFVQTNSKIRQNANQESISSVFGTVASSSEIKKIKKRHSLPTPIVPQHYNFSKRSRSKSYDSCNNHNKSISSIKLTLTRDQSNQQNWVASKSQESSSISKYDNLEKTSHKLNCFTENMNLKQNNLVSNKQHTEVKTSCHLTIGITKIQSCSNKTVPELENNDYISKPVINDNFIGKQSLEKHLSPFLKSRVKRPHHLNETVDMPQSNFTSKRPKLSEHALDTNANINIDINYINNNLDCRNKQERRSVELSQSFNDYSKKDLPKNFKNNVPNLNISLSYSDSYEKHNMINIRSESNRNLQIDHNSNISKNSHQKQKTSSPKRRKSYEQSTRDKRKSVEMDERKKKKIAYKFAEIFGDSDSDALEIIHSPSNLASSEKASSNGNYTDSDGGHDSDANYEKNAVMLDKHEIESVLNSTGKCIEIPIDNLDLEQSKHLSSSIRENQDFEESVILTESTLSAVNESRELSSKAVHPEKSDKNSLSPEVEKSNPTKTCITTQFTEESSDTLLKMSENNVKISESPTKSVMIRIRTKECASKVPSNVTSENSSKTIEKNSLTSITEENSSVVTSRDQVDIHESTSISIETNEFADECVSKVPSNITSENLLKKIEKNSLTSITEENSSEVTSRDQVDIHESTSISIETNEFADECVNKVPSNVTSENILSNCDFSNDNRVETMDLQEGDFDFEVDNNSVYSYECVYSDTEESEDLTCSYSVTIQSLGNNDCTNNSEIPSVANNEKAKTEDFNSCNAEKSFDYDSDNQLIICESPIQNEVPSSTIPSPDQINSQITFGNSNNINKEISLLSSIAATEPSSTGSLPNKNLFEDLKDPNILKKYNLFQEEIILEEVTNKTSTESIENLEEQQAFESLNKTNGFLETATSENILEEHSNQSLSEQLKSSIEKFKKYNIYCIDIDTAKSEENSNLTVNSVPGTFKVRNINELLEKPQTLSQTNIDSANEKTKGKVVTTQSENNFSNLIESIYNSIFSSLDQLILMVNSISFPTQIQGPVGINNIPNIDFCENVLPANSLQSNALPNDSQVCIKLASNMFSNEFSTTDELPTIYSMESPPLDTLQALIPATTTEDVEEYKKLLLRKLDSYLEALQKLSGKEFVKLSNYLFKYNTLSKYTWKFQRVILTIMQCISRLIYCATGENKRRIIKIIEKTINLSKYKQICLKEAVILYQKLANQGLCHKYIFLYDPVLVEFDDSRRSMSNKDSKMNDSQMTIYLQQITSYRSLQKLPHLEISDLKAIANRQTTTHQINSFQNFSRNGNQMTVSNLQNTQISHQVQCNQTMSVPSCVLQLNSNHISPLSMPRNPVLQQVCLMCKKASIKIVCICYKAGYCSTNCQGIDWVNHTKTCKKM